MCTFFVCRHMFSFLLDFHFSEWNWWGIWHLYLTSEQLPDLFFKVSAHVIFLPAVNEGSNFFPSLQTLVCLFDYSLAGVKENLMWFWLAFPWWLIMANNVFSRALSLLLTLWNLCSNFTFSMRSVMNTLFKTSVNC